MEKEELLQDLLATVTVMDELWHYHPDNPYKKDITQEFKVLETLKNILDENEEKIVQNKYDEKYNLLLTKIESLVNIFSVNTFYNEVKDYEKLLKNQQEVAESIKIFLKSKMQIIIRYNIYCQYNIEQKIKD